MITDRLIEKLRDFGNPTALGLDTDPVYLPEPPKPGGEGEAVFAFNKALMDALREIVPAIKVQVAYYEALGPSGMEAFRETLAYGKKLGFITIADCKRNDIGPTAKAYAKAYFGGAFWADFLTVNGYLGTDGIAPFLEYAPEHGIFALVKTSNLSSGELQDLRFEDGRMLYEAMADQVSQWGKSFIGEYGYSAAGAVVGATYPEQGETLRKRMPHTFFLVPGYGAQGASGEALSGMMDARGEGILVNASRSLLLAYRKTEYAGLNFAEAARKEALAMRDDLRRASEFAKSSS
jgi:orotidine-5'-phosphate decarboxylase